MENFEQDLSQTPDLKYASTAQVVKSGILGFFVGLAVIVPGVSGSAVAIIFKLYEKLLYAIGNLFRRFKLCLLFLLPILVGAILGFVLGFFGVQQLLGVLPFATVALFAGLMLGAYPAVINEVKGQKPTSWRIALFILGVVVPLGLSAVSIYASNGTNSLENLQWYHYILFLVLGYGMALTQLIPGLSATALLMMVGYFSPIMDSVSLTYWQSNPMVFLVYVCLAIGFLLGLFTLSKGISLLLSRFRAPTFYCICGLSLGSLITMFYNPEILVTYSNMGFSDTMDFVDFFLGLALFAAGVAGAYFLVRIEMRKDKASVQ